MRAPGIAGTKRAAELCAGCKHPRVRHLHRGYGACASVTYTTEDERARTGVVTIACNCRRFEESE